MKAKYHIRFLFATGLTAFRGALFASRKVLQGTLSVSPKGSAGTARSSVACVAAAF